MSVPWISFRRAGAALLASVMLFATVLAPRTVAAQGACSLAPEFEAIVQAAGNQDIGPCIEDAWTSGGFFSMRVNDEFTVSIRDSDLVQETQRGILVMADGSGDPEFFGFDGSWWHRGPGGQFDRGTLADDEATE